MLVLSVNVGIALMSVPDLFLKKWFPFYIVTLYAVIHNPAKPIY